ncbi:hypothetical protein [Enterococcus hermanniensis]|uniref:Uncharacterized protein n=1 Tax=Enterococcus hermanniensis TaxID=249189 RepID=A0A1L8TS80_9ENTE|nr:hypothetical protein [Enterococcus hermanniensis]OJG47140.1 hypothetical protein RV04_GL000387 [Enterococcus hermanniensis]
MSKKSVYLLPIIYILLFLAVPQEAQSQSLELIPAVNQGARYPVTVEGFKQLLLDIDKAGTAEEYDILLDGELDLSQASIGRDFVVEDPSLDTITLMSIESKLTIKGKTKDAILRLPDQCFLGQAISFSNLTLQVAQLFGNGHSLLFENIQHLGKTCLYGGGNRDLTGDPVLLFDQVAGGTWEIYGGNEKGALTGDIQIKILSMIGEIDRLCGGSATGEITGNITTEICSLDGRLLEYYGGGLGTELNAVTVNGIIKNRLSSDNTNFTLGNFIGGVARSTTGMITNKIEGKGSFSDNGCFVGGSQIGEIYGGITTSIDSRAFHQGERSFIGGNQRLGAIYGSITNKIYAGKANAGSFKRIDGAGGLDISKVSLTNSENLLPAVDLNDPQKRTAEEIEYDQLTAESRLALAKSKTNFLVVGNVTTQVLGGCVSDVLGMDNTINGAGSMGVIKGDVHLSLGEASLAYSKSWGLHMQKVGKDPDILTTENYLGALYGFSVAAGGGSAQETLETSLYIQGKTTLDIYEALVQNAYGGSFSGIIEGECQVTCRGGQVTSIFGAGSGCYRIYGDSLFEMTGGKLENVGAAGSEKDRRMIGTAQTKIVGGDFLGTIVGTYGRVSNHMIDGDVKTHISGGRFFKSNDPTKIIGSVAKEGMISGDIELRVTGKVELADDLQIIAGRPKAASAKNYLGGPAKQVTFSMETDQQFSGMEIIGDGSENTKTLSSSKVYLDICTPQGNFSLVQGMVKNSFAGELLHEVMVDIKDAKAIKQLIASDTTSFTNHLIAKSKNQVALKIGTAKIDEVLNFTHLTVSDQLTAQKILNGSEAKSENFAQMYHQFGEVELLKEAIIKVEQLKTGSLKAATEAELHSPAGAENIYLNKLVTESHLIWRLLTSSRQQEIIGTYFGVQSGFPIITFTDQSQGLTPDNFIGFDEFGYSYTGDNSEQTSYAVAATILEYQVVSPYGEIKYLPARAPDNEPLPVAIWGNGTSRFGRVVVPLNSLLPLDITFVESESVEFQQAELKISNGEERQIIEKRWFPESGYHHQLQASFQQTTENLELVAVPSEIDFGTHSIGQTTIFYPQIVGKLQIKDTRIEKENWQLKLKAISDKKGELFFKKQGQIYSLEEEFLLMEGQGSFETDFSEWDTKTGIFLRMAKERQKIGTYSFSFHWVLTTKVE